MHISRKLFLILISGLATHCSDDKSNDSKAPTEIPSPGLQLYSAAVSADKPLLAVFGDSISTGVLANTELGKNLDASLGQQILALFEGDTADKEAVQSKLSNPTLAAATTDQPYGLRSQMARAAQLTPDQVGVVSMAQFGARASDIPMMMQRLEADTGVPKAPETILVMLGGNDFCSGATVEEFATTYQNNVTAIHSKYPEARLIIAPVPPVQLMAGLDFTYGPSIPGLEGEGLTCKTLRQRSCPRIYDADAATRVQGLNAAIKSTYDQLQAGGTNAVWVQGLIDWPLAADDLAVDCFHPSAKGQQLLGGFIGQALGG